MFMVAFPHQKNAFATFWVHLNSKYLFWAPNSTQIKSVFMADLNTKIRQNMERLSARTVWSPIRSRNVPALYLIEEIDEQGQ